MVQDSDYLLKRLKLRDLRILAAVAKAGSMARAARKLLMSQPAVSKAVQDLEAILGARLFDRTPRGIEPTALGSVMLHRVTAALNELSQGASDLEFLSNPTHGELRVVCSEGMASGILPVILQRLLNVRPGLSFHVFASDSPDQSYGRLVVSRDVEIMLGRYPKPFMSTDLEVEHLFDDPLVVVAGRHHPAARRRKLKLTQLMDEAWILMPTQAAIAGVVHNVFTASGLPVPKAAVYTMSIHVRYAMLASGNFITTMPASSLRVSHLQSLMTILPVDIPGGPNPVGLVKAKGRTLSPVAELFAETARAVSRQTMDTAPQRILAKSSR